MAQHFYVYYRIRTAAVEAARAAVTGMQLELARVSGVQGRIVMRRDEPELWMEIYENVLDPESFETLLAGLAGTTALQTCLAEGCVRTVECFRD